MSKNKIKVGDLIFAKAPLVGTLFENRILLIVNSNETDGCFGFILNDPGRLPIREVFSPVPTGKWQSRQFFAGGPVDDDELFMLERGSVASNMGGELIDDGVYFGGHWSELSDLLDAPEDLLMLYLGYAGWSAGQLEDEIAEGSWEYLQNYKIYDLLGLLSTQREFDRDVLLKILQSCKK